MLGADPVRLVQGDDPREVAWNSFSGSGTAEWKWSNCCTDDAVVGPLPAESFSMYFRITYNSMPTTNALKVGSFDKDTSVVNFETTDIGTLPYEFRIRTLSTTSYCASFKIRNTRMIRSMRITRRYCAPGTSAAKYVGAMAKRSMTPKKLRA